MFCINVQCSKIHIKTDVFIQYIRHACVPVRNVFELVLLTDCKGLVPLLATPVARCDGFYGDTLLQPMLQFRESSTTATQWY